MEENNTMIKLRSKKVQLNKYSSAWVEGGRDSFNTLYFRIQERVFAIRCSDKSLDNLIKSMDSHRSNGSPR